MNNKELYFYDFEVFKHDWLVVFRHFSSRINIMFHNDLNGLKEFLSKAHMLIGFNNYYYDDVILYALVKENYTNLELYKLSQNLIKGTIVPQKYKVGTLITLDCMQELRQGVGLKLLNTTWE